MLLLLIDLEDIAVHGTKVRVQASNAMFGDSEGKERGEVSKNNSVAARVCMLVERLNFQQVNRGHELNIPCSLSRVPSLLARAMVVGINLSSVLWSNVLVDWLRSPNQPTVQ